MPREKSREEIIRKGQRKLLDVMKNGFHFERGAIAQMLSPLNCRVTEVPE